MKEEENPTKEAFDTEPTTKSGEDKKRLRQRCFTFAQFMISQA